MIIDYYIKNEFEKYQNLIEGKGDQSLIGRMNSSFE
jgi:hypothetical protein